MKTYSPFIFLSIVIISCNSSGKKVDNTINTKDKSLSAYSDTIPKVTGIGGIFFISKNPKATKDWYGKHLGLAMDEYGSPFEFRNANNHGQVNYLRWGLFDDTTDYLNPSAKDFMINYRVQNIEGLVRNLRASGVIITDSITTYEYGKFVHIMDPEGNKIELWGQWIVPLQKAT